MFCSCDVMRRHVVSCDVMSQDWYAQNTDLSEHTYSKKISVCQYVVDTGEMVCLSARRSACGDGACGWVCLAVGLWRLAVELLHRMCVCPLPAGGGKVEEARVR